MKNFSFYFFAFISVFLVGCQNEESDWHKVSNMNNSNELNSFIDKYPATKHFISAQEKILCLNKAEIISNYSKKNIYDTLYGKVNIDIKMVRKPDGGFAFVSTPKIEANGNTYIFYPSPSLKAINIRSEGGTFAVPVDKKCKIIGPAFRANSLPEKESLNKKLSGLEKEADKIRTNDFFAKIAPFDFKKVLYNTAIYKDSLHNDVLRIIYHFKKISFEYDLAQSLLGFIEQKESYQNFIFPIYIENLEYDWVNLLHK